MTTHYAVITFCGDPTDSHPDEALRGRPPSLDLIAAGSQESCWAALTRWTETHPLREGEEAEVLARTGGRRGGFGFARVE